MGDRVVFPTLELPMPVRELCSLARVELHERTSVRHGHDAKHAQPDVRHAVTWSGFAQMLFCLSERGHSGPLSFSFSRKLYRKRPDKLG
jgi:hypothetical protein